MMHSVEQLEAELMLLPISERARLAERLISSLDDEEDETEYALASEAQRRLVAFDAGEAAGYPAADIIAEAHRRLL
jgi:putative addiction module component (TIGR02574 family)